MNFKPAEYVTLEPFERDHAVVVGQYRPPPKQGESKSVAAAPSASASKEDSED